MMIKRYFDHADYAKIWRAMQQFTDERRIDTADELWIVEHLPVYTLGQNGNTKDILQANAIPIVQTDRGGQVTYHGPGQLVIYTLLDLARYGLGVRGLVSLLENSVIALLRDFAIEATSNETAPGVYIDKAKICSIGLRIRKGYVYHGLALNVNMDMSPFLAINPCGYVNLAMTQLRDWQVDTTPFELAPSLVAKIEAILAN